MNTTEFESFIISDESGNDEITPKVHYPFIVSTQYRKSKGPFSKHLY